MGWLQQMAQYLAGFIAFVRYGVIHKEEAGDYLLGGPICGSAFHHPGDYCDLILIFISNSSHLDEDYSLSFWILHCSFGRLVKLSCSLGTTS
jgi:hypothetical protein